MTPPMPTPPPSAAGARAGAAHRIPASAVVGAMLATAALVALAMSPAETYRTVLAPVAAIVALGLGFFVTLITRSEELPVDEIGVWYMAIISAYMVIPLVVYVALGFEYTPLNDLRLFLAQPGPREVARVGWYYAAYAAAFAVVYVAVRGRRPAIRVVPEIPPSTAAVALTLMIAAGLTLTAIDVAYDLSGRAASYEDTYRLVQQLPLAVGQLRNLTIGLRAVLGIVVLAWAFADVRRRKWIVVAWLSFEVAQTLIVAGQRTSLLLLFVSAAFLYHRAVRPIRLRTAVLGGTLLLVAFVALGFYRAYRQLTEGAAGGVVGVTGGEFDALFSNAIDLLRRREGGELTAIPVALRLVDLVSFLPSQILPFAKYDAAGWYVSTFFPAAAESGQGYAFGVVPQAVIGFGLPELVLRGAVIGGVFAALDRYARRRARKLWPTVAYLLATLWSYQSFRSNSFYAMSMFVQQFLPCVLIVESGRALLVGAIGRRSSSARLQSGASAARGRA